MKKNVGGLDKRVRLVIGPILIVAGIAGYAGFVALAVGPIPQALASVIILLIGVILLVTGIVEKCPINAMLGINTYSVKEPEPSQTGNRAN